MGKSHTLAKIRLFESLEPEQLDTIQAKGDMLTFLPGDTIFEEGDEGTHLYCILDGRVDISFKLSDASEQAAVHTATDGSVFGEFCLFQNKKRTATTRAIKDTRVFHMSAKALKEVFTDDPQVGYVVMSNLCKTLVGRVSKTTKELRTSLMW